MFYFSLTLAVLTGALILLRLMLCTLPPSLLCSFIMQKVFSLSMIQFVLYITYYILYIIYYRLSIVYHILYITFVFVLYRDSIFGIFAMELFLLFHVLISISSIEP